MFQLEANYLSFVTHVNLPGNFYLADYYGLTYFQLRIIETSDSVNLSSISE